MTDFRDQVKTPPPKTPSSQSDLTGHTIGRFAVEARLGSGGMGEVYRAVDTRLKRTVAIKRMSLRGGLTEEAHTLFLREGQRASSLQHPNIASIYDVFEENGEVFLVMEYVEGATLRSRIGQPMPLEEFFDIAIQCTHALTAAHGKGILHGDVKPENIMLGGQGQAKLLDFGVARRLPSEDPESVTATVDNLSHGHLMGTPSYMAPEVLKGGVPDARADIFALGIVFYEMLAGRHPFMGVNVTVTTAHILDDREAAALERSKVKIASPVAAIVARTLMKDASQRYASAQALGKDLETVKHGGRPTAGAHKSWIHRLWWLIPVAVMAAFAILAFFRHRTHAPATANSPVAVSQPQAARLAVLPPQLEGNDPNLAAFADGLSAIVSDKLAGLSQNHNLEIIDTARVVKAQANAGPQAVSTLGANLTLQLKVQQADGMTQAAWHVVNVKTGQTIADQSLMAPSADPFSLQDRVADGVVKALQLDLRPDEKTSMSIHGTTEPSAYDYFVQGKGYLLQTSRPENVANALLVLNQALDIDPNFGKAYAARGEAYWRDYQANKQAKWVAQASQDCYHAVSLGNAGADGHLCLGLVAAGTGKYQEAASEYQRAIELEPGIKEGYVGLANAYSRLNRLSDAENAYRQAISQDPNSSWTWQQLGNFYLQQAQYGQAEVAFQEAIKLAPENHMDYSNLGVAYLFQGNRKAAIATLEQSIKLRPTSGAFANLGTAYYQMRRFTDAANNYQQALRLSGQDPDLWGNLADAFHYSGQTSKAHDAYQKQLQMLQQLLSVNPKDAERQGDLASCYAMLGDKQNAVEHLAQSLQLGHGDKDLLFNAAVVYNDLGETGVALEWLQKALAAGYSSSIVKDSPSFDNLRDNLQFQQLLSHPPAK